ncbi:MAG: hypothetical protein STSR0009_08190 [Methanoregula sp.]
MKRVFSTHNGDGEITSIQRGSYPLKKVMPDSPGSDKIHTCKGEPGRYETVTHSRKKTGGSSRASAVTVALGRWCNGGQDPLQTLSWAH